MRCVVVLLLQVEQLELVLQLLLLQLSLGKLLLLKLLQVMLLLLHFCMLLQLELNMYWTMLFDFKESKVIKRDVQQIYLGSPIFVCRLLFWVSDLFVEKQVSQGESNYSNTEQG